MLGLLRSSCTEEGTFRKRMGEQESLKDEVVTKRSRLASTGIFIPLS